MVAFIALSSTRLGLNKTNPIYTAFPFQNMGSFLLSAIFLGTFTDH